MLCASVAIAGVPPFSGYHSKDAILEAAYEHAPWMYWVGVFTAGMTAFYVFRAFFLTFFGEYQAAGKTRRRMVTVMATTITDTRTHRTITAMVTAAARIAAVDVDSAGDSRRAEPGAAASSTFRNSWSRCFRSHEGGTPRLAGATSPIAAGLGGIALALPVLRGLARHSRMRWRAPSRRSTRWIYNKYFVDEFYDSTVVEPDRRRLAQPALARRRRRG